ncbi:hypothetical protein JQU17_00465 [Ponticoccus sp. SC2-23]|uniref:hypothetical protein n=1 Tax=Alexandriicola marinus TaxID=2081710 RepID=UPI000FD83A88|nr:hypothetical protein [Alexandriicola marinus]MBM1218651.1 hypothetical protein [Ponticoccus sp. SC6-9]MBM1224277.1 hypothetical protein [Ponticoccus sp. SC6-15]MBM1229944.1 hypothetical protein [Ponticoccus sp. SC6-38]MBM1233243.1 hypothetical protein [Ponticoccus sp. SC6-45]MBM1236807.1 hypothetical protein [Ponticoccus sp. SC6-49]MBM1242254.1 hypothetical protein [Ponticoccus sp. SC2-64]MBM1246767.1 hypothetical protein [Ponticoccus sp. SC6-42]MBM1251245.1 hypothetical protein [Pontico
MRIWQGLVTLSLILMAGLGLLVMSGHARGLLSAELQAELHVQDFPLPPDMGVDANRVADFMAGELQDRMDTDIAIRLTMDPNVAQQVKTVVLPRLMNVVAVRTMMREVPELSELLDLGTFRRTVSGTVHSRTAAEDVALTVPGALLATVDGTRVPVTTTSTGMTALELGSIAAGESRDIVLWLDESAGSVDLGRAIQLGATEGQRGRVLLWGDTGWFGADVEALRWGRWVVGGVLAAAFLFGLAGAMLPFLGRRKAGPDRGDAGAYRS